MSRIKWNPEINPGHVLTAVVLCIGFIANSAVVYGKYVEMQTNIHNNASRITKTEVAIEKLTEISQRLQIEQARQQESVRAYTPRTQ